MTRRYPWLYAAVAVADTAFAATGRGRLRRISKPLLMPTLMAGRDRPTRRALALGGIGDMALLGDSEAAFRVGLASFLLGHAAWIAALRRRGSGGRLRTRPAAAAPYFAAFAVLQAYLWQRTGKDRFPVLVYGTALLAMSLVALDSDSTATASGGALFLTSDALIALERFGEVHLPVHEGLVMATYLLAQALLADGGPAGD